MPKKLHYIFDSGAPQSPAKPLQDLIVLKKNAAHCRRWVLHRGAEKRLVDGANRASVFRPSSCAQVARSRPRAIIVIGGLRQLPSHLVMIGLVVDERRRPANHFQPLLLKEIHHLRRRVEPVEFLTLESAVRAELRFIEGKIVVSRFPR